MRLILTERFPTYLFYRELGCPKSGRNTSTWIINLSTYLAMLDGIELHIVTHTDEIEEDKIIKANGITYHYLKCPKRLRAATLFQFDRHRLHKKFNEIKPDIINAHHTDEFAYSAVTSKFPSVITVHGIFSELLKLSPSKLLNRDHVTSYIERIVLKRAKDIISTSPYVEEVIRHMTKANLHFIENSVNPALFEINNSQDHSNEILYIGVIHPNKGVLDLVKSITLIMKSIPGVKLTLIGSISSHAPGFFQKLKLYIKEQGIEENIEFLVFVDEDIKLKYLSKSSILVLPSKQETFSVVVAEAMAAGLPVVASRVGGVPYTAIEDKSALFFESGNIEELAEKSIALLKDKETRLEMGRFAKEEALRRFHPKLIAEQTKSICENILDIYKKC